MLQYSVCLMADHLLSFAVVVVGTELVQEGGMGIDCMETHCTGSIQVLILGKHLLASCFVLATFRLELDFQVY